MKPAGTSIPANLYNLQKPICRVKVYIKNSCITCRRFVTEMERLQVDMEKRDIFKEPLSESEIKKILRIAKVAPRELLRKKDKMYKQLGLDDPKITDAELVRCMAENPGLVRRPIVFGNGKIMIGKVESGDLKALWK